MTASTGPSTLRDVARQAGVSIKTASRVLNDDPRVAAVTRAHVAQIMAELNYHPDLAARSLRRGHDQTVGVVVDSIGDRFFAELAASVETVLDAGGYRVMVASSRRDTDREAQIVSELVQRRCAGLLVVPTGPDSLSWLRQRDLDVVFVDRVGSYPGAQSVVVADFENARLATEHLIRHGHRRIALLSDVPTLDTTRLRHHGFRAAMADAGIAVEERLVRIDCPEAWEATQATAELLALDHPPTALISTSTRLSLGVVPALHMTGRTDIAMVAYGDFSMASSLSPAITVIAHDPAEVGRTAAELLLARLRGAEDQPAAGAVIHVPAPLIPRGSGELRPWE